MENVAAHDIFHDAVKHALEKEGWLITHDPLSLQMIASSPCNLSKTLSGIMRCIIWCMMDKGEAIVQWQN